MKSKRNYKNSKKEMDEKMQSMQEEFNVNGVVESHEIDKIDYEDEVSGVIEELEVFSSNDTFHEPEMNVETITAQEDVATFTFNGLYTFTLPEEFNLNENLISDFFSSQQGYSQALVDNIKNNLSKNLENLVSIMNKAKAVGIKSSPEFVGLGELSDYSKKYYKELDKPVEWFNPWLEMEGYI